MNRRAFVTGLGAVLAAPHAVEGQQAGKVWRIGILWPNSASSVALLRTAFRDGLREYGYIDDQNVTLESRFADGYVERLNDLAAELVRLNVDVIFVSSGPAAVAVRKATAIIPIVFIAVTDPVALGLVKSLAKPGGNATGLSNVHIELTQKRLAMLKEIAPQIGAVGFLKPPLPDVDAYVTEVDAA